LSLGSDLKLIPLFLAMILLGSALAIYADSPLLIIPFLGVLALTSFAALSYALYILVAFLPFSFRFIFVSGTEVQIPTEPLLAIMAVALALRWIVTERHEVQIKFPFKVPMLLYAISLCLSMINATYLYSAAKGSLRVVVYMMLAVVVFNVVTNRRRLKWLFILFIASATMAVGWTVIFLADRLDMWRWTSAYEGTPFTSYMHFGSFAAVILLILLARSVFDRGMYDRVIWTALLAFYGIAICFSFSRGVWLSFIAAVGFLLLQRSEGVQHKRILIIGGAIALLIVLLSVPYASDLITSRVKSAVNLRYAANKERLLRWGTAFIMFTRHPITGCGYGSFAFSYVNDPAIVGTYLSQFGMGAHSEYLQILAETGLIGFLTWMWVIISFFLYGFRLLRRLGPAESGERRAESRERRAESEERRAESGEQEEEPYALSSKPYVLHSSFYRSLVIGIMAAELSLLLHFFVNNLLQADIIGVPFWLLIGLLPAIGNMVEKESQKQKT
jgi:O-antigen ligase